MSTIVYRDGILAGDSRAFSGSRTPIGAKIKIAELEDGVLVGVSTTQPGLGEAFIDWYATGCQPSERPDMGQQGFDALVIDADANVFFYNDSFMPSGPLLVDYIAIGSGAEYALGAMAAGKTAEEAVEIASGLDVWTGGPIFTITHKKFREE